MIILFFFITYITWTLPPLPRHVLIIKVQRFSESCHSFKHAHCCHEHKKFIMF